MKYFNNRNSRGQFTRRVSRGENGQFAPALKVVSGRLYDYRGATVRALHKSETGRRMVSFHKTLFGFVKDSELKRASTRKVEKYLRHTSK